MENFDQEISIFFEELKNEMDAIFENNKNDIFNFFIGYTVENSENVFIFKIKKDKTQLLPSNFEDLFQSNNILKLNEISLNYALNVFMLNIFSDFLKKIDLFLSKFENLIDIELIKDKLSRKYLDTQKTIFSNYKDTIENTFLKLFKIFEAKIMSFLEEFLLKNDSQFNQLFNDKTLYKIEYPPLLRIDYNFINFIKNFEDSVNGLSFLENYEIKEQKKVFEQNQEFMKIKFNSFISTILKLSSTKLTSKKDNINELDFKFDSAILFPNKRVSLLELTNKFFVETLADKVPFLMILEKMKNTEYSFYIKEYDVNTLKEYIIGNYIKTTIFFGEINKEEKFYPLKISFDFDTIHKDIRFSNVTKSRDNFIFDTEDVFTFLFNEKKYIFFSNKYLDFPNELKIRHKISPLASNVFMQDIIGSFSASNQKDKDIQKILNKNESIRDNKDISVLQDFENKVVKIEIISKYAFPELNTKEIVIKNTPKNFFAIDIEEIKKVFDEDNLSLNTIKLVRSNYGPKGLKYFLALNYLFSVKSKNGRIFISLNDFLETVGEKREKNGSFNIETKIRASQIIKMFGNLTLKLSSNNKQSIKVKLFDLEVQFERDGVLEKFILEAKEWYFKSFDKENQFQYTYILNKIIEENDGEHSITIALYSLLSIRWRMKLNEKFKITTILDWLDIGYVEKEDIKNRFFLIHRLYKEIEYMKRMCYIKNYTITLDNEVVNAKLNELKDDLFKKNYLIEFEPPDIIKEKIDMIHNKKDEILETLFLPSKQAVKEEFNLITRNDVSNILMKGKLHENLKKSHFATNLGISRQYLDLFLKGERGISLELSNKITELYGHLLKDWVE